MVDAQDTFFSLVGGALRLQEGAFRTLETLPTGSRTALLVVLLAGLSTALGQSAMLFINRVKPKRFLVSLLISSVIYAFTYFFWTASILLIGRYVFGSEAELGTVARAVGLGYAPQLFGFLVLTPYLGVPLQIGLGLWNLLAILVGATVALALAPWSAFVCGLLGWVALQLLQSTVGRPLVAAARWLRRRGAGVELVTDPRELRKLLEPDTVTPLVSPREKVREPRDG